jgi:hypothetical protein
VSSRANAIDPAVATTADVNPVLIGVLELKQRNA